jgi:hypothetical protein
MDQGVARGASFYLSKTNQITAFEIAIAMLELPHG